MRPTLLSVAFLLCCVAAQAHADTIDVFNFFGTPVVPDPYTVSGSLTIDVTTGAVTAASLLSDSISLSGVLSQNGPVVDIGTAMFYGKLSGDAGSYIGYNGGKFDLSGLRANEDFVGNVTLGSSTQSLAAPEPTALLLTATGFVFALPVLLRRRRFFRPVHAQSCRA